MDEKHALELFLGTRTEESFCVLFEMLYPRVRRYFLVRAFDSMTAEELAQNVLLKGLHPFFGVEGAKSL